MTVYVHMFGALGEFPNGIDRENIATYITFEVFAPCTFLLK